MSTLPQSFPEHMYAPRRPPYAHQLEALRRGWGRPGYGYLMEMGLGKSRVAIDEFCTLYALGAAEALLVVASKSVYTNWSRRSESDPGELQTWMWGSLYDESMLYVWRSGAGKRDSGVHAALLAPTPHVPRVLVVNVEAVSLMDDAYDLCAAFVRAHKTMVIVDESTLIKNHKSARSVAMMRLGRTAAWRRILTGSPITGRTTDLFSQFEFVQPSCLGYRTFFTYRQRYCRLREIQVSDRKIITVVGAQNTDELADRVARFSYRALKKDCLDLPPKTYVRRDIEMTKEQTNAYAEMRRTAMLQLGQTESVTTNIVITQLLRLHQIACGHIKLDDGRVLRLPQNRISELLDVVGETEESVIVWCTYQSDVTAVREALREVYGDDCCAEWHGSVPMAQREAQEQDFKAGRRRFMVATQSSAARGRTWLAGTLVVYYSNSHDLELREQSEDRPHRIGQTSPVTYVDFVAKCPADQNIVASLRAKKSVNESVLRDGIASWI